MNTPLRFESLLWMASPMAAWAQASLPTEALPTSEPATAIAEPAQLSGESSQAV
jgi:hypothetical protein